MFQYPVHPRDTKGLREGTSSGTKIERTGIKLRVKATSPPVGNLRERVQRIEPARRRIKIKASKRPIAAVVMGRLIDQFVSLGVVFPLKVDTGF